MEVKKTLVNWDVVHLCNASMETLKLVIWGEPEGAPDRYVVTSPVKKIEVEAGDESALVYTVNSVYRVVGSGSQYRLPLEAASMLRQGHSPDDVTKFYRFRSQGPKRELTEDEREAGIKIAGAPLLPPDLGTR